MAITNYWEGHTVESAKKERKRLKNYNPNGAPRRANNLDDDLKDVPSYEEHEESEMDDD